MEILKCKKCGYDLYPDDTVCERCNTPVAAKPKEQANIKIKEAGIKKERKLSIPVLLCIIFGSLVLCALIVTAVILIRNAASGAAVSSGITGTWKVDSVEYKGIRIPMSKLEDMGYEDIDGITIVINENGEALIIDPYDSDYNEIVEWEETEEYIEVGYYELMWKGKRLYYEEDEDVKVFFKKISDDQFIDRSLVDDEYYDEYDDEEYEDDDEYYDDWDEDDEDEDFEDDEFDEDYEDEDIEDDTDEEDEDEDTYDDDETDIESEDDEEDESEFESEEDDEEDVVESNFHVIEESEYENDYEDDYENDSDDEYDEDY